MRPKTSSKEILQAVESYIKHHTSMMIKRADLDEMQNNGTEYFN